MGKMIFLLFSYICSISIFYFIKFIENVMDYNKKPEYFLLTIQIKSSKLWSWPSRGGILFILSALLISCNSGSNETPRGKIIYPDSLAESHPSDPASNSFGEDSKVLEDNKTALLSEEELLLEEELEDEPPSRPKKAKPNTYKEPEEEDVDFKPGEDLDFNLQRYGYSEININSISKTYKQTPLMKASSWGDEKAVRYLLERGADINLRDKLGRTALHLTIRPAHVETLKLLLEYKADITIKDNDGNTPLHLAVLRQNEEITKILLEKGAPLDIRNNKNETPLDLAQKQKNQKFVELLTRYWELKEKELKN
jgi:hypothetical protein